MYGKIFESIYDGTLVEHWQALVTFQQMIVLCNSDGVIDMTPYAISRRTGIPIEHIETGISILEQPDKYSRTKDEDGRRIIRIDSHRNWGWKIVNHEYYKKLASYEDKKAADRERIRLKREQERNESQGVAACSAQSQEIANVAHTDTDENTNENKKNTPLPPQGGKPKNKKKKEHKESTIQIFEHYIKTVSPPNVHIKRQSALNNISKWQREFSDNDLKSAAENYNGVKNKEYIKGPTNFYGVAGQSMGFFKDYLPENFDATYHIEKEPQCQYRTITNEDQIFTEKPQ